MAITALLVAGCTGGLFEAGGPPLRTYWLDPLTPVSVPGTPTVRVEASPGLESDRILSLGTDGELTAFAGARWSGPVPALVENALQRSMMPADEREILVEVYVHRFFVDAGNDRFDVAFDLRVDGRSCRREASQAVAEQSLTAIVAAAQEAVGTAVRDSIELILSSRC